MSDSTTFRNINLSVGDEESFIAYAENVVYRIQNYLSLKEGIVMSGIPVIDISARIEDLIYADALKEFGLAASAKVWKKIECIQYYQV